MVSETVRIIDPPHPRIFESWEPYKDFFYTNSQGWVLPNIDKIQRLGNDHDFVIANCSTEHWGSERDFPLVKRLHDLLAEHLAKDFVCLSHDPSDQVLDHNILYFPFYAWRKSWKMPDQVRTGNADRKYLFSNLNRFARDFRVANWLMWQQKTYRHRCLITLHNAVQDNHDYDGYFGLTDGEIAVWQNVKNSLPTSISDGFEAFFDINHPAFSDCYLHLVSETTIKDKIFLTEKTWQPILAGQLLIIWGNTGIVAHLRELGVDVFDDIVDHGYDEITDHRTRLEYIHKELDRLALLDWPEIYRWTIKRRQNNRDKLHDGIFVSPYVAELKRRLPEGIW